MVVSLVERSIAGPFHTVSPAPPFGFGQMLEQIAAEVAPPGTQLTWVSQRFPARPGRGRSGAAAVERGRGGRRQHGHGRARPRPTGRACGRGPLRETIADIRAEDREPGADRPGIGLTPEREADLLARWNGRH